MACTRRITPGSAHRRKQPNVCLLIFRSQVSESLLTIDKGKIMDLASRNSASARTNMTLGVLLQIAFVAIIAIVVFGDVSTAADSLKQLVAFGAIVSTFTSWIFISNALMSYQKESEDLTSAEKKTAVGKNLKSQPWPLFQIYTLAVTVVSIYIAIKAIYN